MTTYFKYNMTLNGAPYKEIFKDHFKAADWLDDADYDGDKVVVLSIEDVTVQDVLADEDFTENYRHEVALEMVDPNGETYRTYPEVEARLRELGYLK
jgi:hypothetical protein